MKRILAIDNHPVMLKYMTNLLKKEGHQVKTAEDGLSALDILETYVPNIIFCDMVMPRIDGEKLCRIVRSMPALKDVFFVIVSGVAAESEIDFRGFGADLCIAKGPFNVMSEHVLNVLAEYKTDASLDRTGEILGLEGVHPRSVSKELWSTKRHFEVILDHMSEGMLELTSDWRIVYVNPSTVFLTGMGQERILGMDFINLFHESHQQSVGEMIKEMDDRPFKIHENFPLLVNGRQVSLYILPVRDKDRLLYIVIMADISAKRVAQTRLRQALKMEAIATLAGGVAHEFNNALMGIMGNIELLKLDFPENEKSDRYFEIMKKSGYRMSRLTDQLLAYAKGGKYQPKSLGLNDFVMETLPILKHDLSPEIRVETHFPKNISHIKADHAQMQMVLSAILSNSNEAIEDEGLIKITTENQDIDEDFTKRHPSLKPGPHVCLTIEDDGKGMDEKTRKGIFEPFFTTKFQGRGMGMAAAYGIVMNHDGGISVDSELGKGTAVHIYFPAISAESKEQGEKVKQPEIELNTGKGTILMIEDEEVVVDVTRAMLAMLGYRVMAAETGKEAVHMAKTFDGQIDLALLDIKLPDMEGGKVYPLIMEARPDLKVIVFSGYAIDGPARKILDAGAQDFIQKPFSMTTLSEKLKEVLKRE